MTLHYEHEEITHSIVFVTIGCNGTKKFGALDTQDYKSVGVYDRWEHSPFRTGELAGNCEVVDNPDLTNNPNKKVLGFQRSRLASNIFGARIELKKPIATGSHPEK